MVNVKNIANKNWQPRTHLCGYVAMSTIVNDARGVLALGRDNSYFSRV